MDSYTLTAKFERFEAIFAVLSNETIGEFRWPIKNLPENIKPGEMIQLKVVTSKVEEEEKYERMRRLLEELIN
jgi:hypothetical protein